MRAVRFAVAGCLLLLACGLLSGCGYNQIQQKDEAVKAAWSEVVNQYQRRADLVPNLVATVKGYATHEEQVFREVTDARAKVGQVTVNANDAASLAKYQAAQSELSSALTRLRVRSISSAINLSPFSAAASSTRRRMIREKRSRATSRLPGEDPRP